MKNKKNNSIMKITFHNPNSSDEIAKFLIKIIAENLSSYPISQQLLNKITKTSSGSQLDECNKFAETIDENRSVDETICS